MKLFNFGMIFLFIPLFRIKYRNYAIFNIFQEKSKKFAHFQNFYYFAPILQLFTNMNNLFFDKI